MSKKSKERKEDFSHKEMEQLTGLPRKAFDDALQKICDMYGFSITDFKAVADEEKSRYFFPPETAELLALLIRHLPEHPMTRVNTDKTKITADQLSDYNKALLKDIDENIPQVFKEIIYCRPCHLVAQRIADWTAPFVKQLTYFIVNLTTLQNQDVGAALREFTKKLDVMNYNLFRGDYITAMTKSLNQKAMDSVCKEFKKEPPSESATRLEMQNVALDSIVAEILRWEVENAKNIRDTKFPNLKDILDYENRRYLFLGLKIKLTDKDGKALFEDIKNPSEEELRKAYYDFIIRRKADLSKFTQAVKMMEHCRKKDAQWGSTDEAIRKKEFAEPQEKSIEERKKILRRNIQIVSRELEEYKRMLEELEKESEEQEKTEILEEIQEEYAKHCESVDNDYSELYDVVDRFVGQALQQLTR